MAPSLYLLAALVLISLAANGDCVLLYPQRTLIQFTFGVSVPVTMNKRGGVVFSSAFQLNYKLPSNLSDLEPTIIPARQMRGLHLQDTYDTIESIFNRHGWRDGKSCLLRTICELAETPFGRTRGHDVLEELLIGVAVPVQLSGRTLVYGQNVQFQYSLPDNATFFTNFFESLSRRRRNTGWNERAAVYDILKSELDRRGIDGKSCLKRDICEAAATPLKDEGLIGELLHLLLSPDDGNVLDMDQEYLDATAAGKRHENCSTIYSLCPDGFGILDRISTVYEQFI